MSLGERVNIFSSDSDGIRTDDTVIGKRFVVINGWPELERIRNDVRSGVSGEYDAGNSVVLNDDKLFSDLVADVAMTFSRSSI